MYDETPKESKLKSTLKALRSPREHLKPFSVSIVNEQPRKHSRLSLDQLYVPKALEKDKKTSKQLKKLNFITASTPRQRVTEKTRLSLALVPRNHLGRLNTEAKIEIPKHKEKIIERRESQQINTNISDTYRELFGKFVSVIEKYKKASKTLSNNNQEMEKQIKRLSRTEAGERFEAFE